MMSETPNSGGTDTPAPKDEPSAASETPGPEAVVGGQLDMADLKEFLGPDFEIWLHHLGGC